MSWETVIGLEVHAQLKTKTKLFSPSRATFSNQANNQTGYIDAALPGVLPVLNSEAVNLAIRFGLAIEATINDLSYFERKNYLYPDLPKGYQISQFQHPIIGKGKLNITLPNGTEKSILINRAHLEEDAGKSLHDAQPDVSGIDLNRAGNPLLEIVTEPCLYSAEEAIAYLKTLHQLLRFINVCDGNMQEGSFRCDINLSLRPHGSKTLGTRTELKNLNSFRFIEKAIHVESLRQEALLESGGAITQETRLYNPTSNATEVMRSKEDENDYRYFPDPDLLPVKLDEQRIKTIQQTMPELPSTIRQRLLTKDALNGELVTFLLQEPEILACYDALSKLAKASPKRIVNWLQGPYSAALNERERSFSHELISLTLLADLLDRLESKQINHKVAKTIFNTLISSGGDDIDEIIKQAGLNQQADSKALETQVKDLINQYPEQAKQYRSGKTKLLAFFVGQIMKQTKGKADPELVNSLIKQQLQED